LIVKRAKEFHYTLINEAHYSSQHRAFTHDLLLPLYQEGYRYLALEAFGYKDSLINKRGFPTSNTGYYIQDSNFGNLVREALEIGYTLVTYETRKTQDGTLRDREQAEAIYEQTWKIDKKGKVLIHAGYSHIGEKGDPNYEPMGAQLKAIVKQDILTIDQVQMVALNDSSLFHPYFKYALNKFGIAQPTIFQNANREILVNPLQSLSIDMQVFHPITKFKKGRPIWVKNEKSHYITLPPKIMKFKHCLIQATPIKELAESVPVDQLVIDGNVSLVLPRGRYRIRIINTNGDLVGGSELTVR